MLCLSSFELYSRWVPLTCVYCIRLSPIVIFLLKAFEVLMYVLGRKRSNFGIPLFQIFEE